MGVLHQGTDKLKGSKGASTSTGRELLAECTALQRELESLEKCLECPSCSGTGTCEFAVLGALARVQRCAHHLNRGLNAADPELKMSGGCKEWETALELEGARQKEGGESGGAAGDGMVLHASLAQVAKKRKALIPLGSVMSEEELTESMRKMLPYTATPGDEALRVGILTEMSVLCGHGVQLPSNYHSPGMRGLAAAAVLAKLKASTTDWAKRVVACLQENPTGEEKERRRMEAMAWEMEAAGEGELEGDQSQAAAAAAKEGAAGAAGAAGDHPPPKSPVPAPAPGASSARMGMSLFSPTADRWGNQLAPRATEGTPGKALQWMRRRRHEASARAVARDQGTMEGGGKRMGMGMSSPGVAPWAAAAKGTSHGGAATPVGQAEAADPGGVTSGGTTGPGSGGRESGPGSANDTPPQSGHSQQQHEQQPSGEEEVHARRVLSFGPPVTSEGGDGGPPLMGGGSAEGLSRGRRAARPRYSAAPVPATASQAPVASSASSQGQADEE